VQAVLTAMPTAPLIGTRRSRRPTCDDRAPRDYDAGEGSGVGGGGVGGTVGKAIGGGTGIVAEGAG